MEETKCTQTYTGIKTCNKIKSMLEKQIMKKIMTAGVFLLLSVATYAQTRSHAGSVDSMEEQEQPAAKPEMKQPPKETSKKKPAPLAAHGGLILVKVQLEGRTSLWPYAAKEDEDYAEQAERLTGLLVFHRADKSGGMPSGMYVWDGGQWLRISLSPAK